MQFVVFSYDAPLGFAVRDALRTRRARARYLNAASWRGEAEDGRAVVVLHPGADDKQTAHLKRIFESDGKGVAFVAANSTVDDFVTLILGPLPEVKEPAAPVEPYVPPVALEPDLADEVDPDEPAAQLGNTTRRKR